MRIEEINMIEDTMSAMNRLVIGAIYIDYPVYLVHLEYKKKNDDPMYFIDWAITHFMKSQPKLDSMSVSKIIGMDYRLIQYRIKNLKEDGMVIEHSDGFRITGAGESYFFNDDEDVPFINASSDFLIDGRSLSIMPKVFYDDKGFVSFDKNSIYPRIILNGAEDNAIKALLAKIEKMSHERKRSVGLPSESKEFYCTDAPSQGLLRIYLVFSCDQDNRCYKDIVYSNQIVNLPSIKEIVDKSYFNDGLRFNYGYDNLDAEKLRNKVFSFSSNGIKEFLQFIFHWNEMEEDWFKYEKSSKTRPLSVSLNIDNFTKSWNRRKLIKCLELGYNQYDKENDFFVRVTVDTSDKSLIRLIELDKRIEISKRTRNLSDIDSIFDEYGECYVRRNLVLLDRLDILEEIDNRKFIMQEERK